MRSITRKQYITVYTYYSLGKTLQELDLHMLWCGQDIQELDPTCCGMCKALQELDPTYCGVCKTLQERDEPEYLKMIQFRVVWLQLGHISEVNGTTEPGYRSRTS